MGYFPFHDEYLDKLKRITDEQMGRLCRAASLYNATGTVCEDEDIGLAFDFIRSDIDRAKEAYEKKCATNAENGKKGGRPRKANKTEQNPTKAEKANAFSETQKSQINKNKTKENINININNKSDFEIALDEFRQYRKDSKHPLNELAEKKLLKELDRLSGGDEAKKIMILDQSIRNGWRGVFDLPHVKSNQNYAQHTTGDLDHLLVSLD